MNARDLLASLAASGVSIRIEGDALKLRPAAALDNELRDRIIGLKPELLLLLSGAASGESTPTVSDVATMAPADERAAHRDRIRALAAQVTPGELLQARKTIEPALRRNCTSEEIHELLLLHCWLDQDGGELTSNGNDDKNNSSEVNA
jgi:hypothetical protein